MFQLLKALVDADVEFVLVGGLAVALQGYQRQTMDIDIVVTTSNDNLLRLIACARENGLRPGIPVNLESLAQPELLDQWHREKGMLAFSLRAPDALATVIDVLIKPVVPADELCRDATVVKVGALAIRVASIAHLITMKTGTGRSKDRIDIEELQKLQSSHRP